MNLRRTLREGEIRPDHLMKSRPLFRRTSRGCWSGAPSSCVVARPVLRVRAERFRNTRSTTCCARLVNDGISPRRPRCLRCITRLGELRLWNKHIFPASENAARKIFRPRAERVAEILPLRCRHARFWR